jgi:hypothetical protein
MDHSACPLTADALHDIIMDVLEEDGFIGSSDTTKKRVRPVRQSLHDSVWGRLLKDPSRQVEGSFSNRKFRRRSVFLTCLALFSCCIILESSVLIVFILSVVLTSFRQVSHAGSSFL